MPLDRHLLERLLTTMIRMRRFDERVTELFQAGHVKGTAHRNCYEITFTSQKE
jgi:TPP-dependent pyruvate/acetoin dehydrogenase alpha subunit